MTSDALDNKYLEPKMILMVKLDGSLTGEQQNGDIVS